ncbi:putative membrane protein [Lachnellula occidentalis]|uniref:Putative membrane protein n=1 Tax=Lachnellula occidentalis TaxID=215460 RepID=A0A8H8S3X3_9HELO|nr:putative membrane protein [Lachnellula occidentalis]
MSPSAAYTPLPPHPTTSPAEPEQDILESLQNIPSNFDLALNGGTNRTFLSPNFPKQADPALLDPEAFRRLSISTISSMGLPHSRSVSPYPASSIPEPKTLKNVWKRFWTRNEGLFLVSFSQLFGALMNVTTRLLELEGDGMHPLQILFARMGLTMIFCCMWMWWKSVPDFPFGAKGIRWLLVGRGICGFFGIYGMYYSLQYLPVADAVVITFLAPSVASYACYLFLKEPFPRSAQYASLVSLLGVFLIARPTSFFTTSSPPTSIPTNGTSTASTSLDASFPTPTSAQRLSAVAVAMVGVLGSAAVFTIIRWIGPRAHPLISVNYFAVWCTLVSTLSLTLPIPSSPSFALPANLRQWSMLLFLGVCGFIMQFLLTSGLAAGGRGNGARATNMIYTNMLFALALDKLVFGQSPGWWSLGGSGLILGSAVVVAVQKQQGEKIGAGGRDEEVGMRMLRGRERGNEVGTEDEEAPILREDDPGDEVGVVELSDFSPRSV